MANYRKVPSIDTACYAACGCSYYELFRYTLPSEHWDQALIEDLDADAFEFEFGAPDSTPLTDIFKA